MEREVLGSLIIYDLERKIFATKNNNKNPDLIFILLQHIQ